MLWFTLFVAFSGDNGVALGALGLESLGTLGGVTFLESSLDRLDFFRHVFCSIIEKEFNECSSREI